MFWNPCELFKAVWGVEPLTDEQCLEYDTTVNMELIGRMREVAESPNFGSDTELRDEFAERLYNANECGYDVFDPRGWSGYGEDA